MGNHDNAAERKRRKMVAQTVERGHRGWGGNHSRVVPQQRDFLTTFSLRIRDGWFGARWRGLGREGRQDMTRWWKNTMRPKLREVASDNATLLFFMSAMFVVTWIVQVVVYVLLP
jgi:hypothetical protein